MAIRQRSFVAHNSLGVALKDARRLEEAATEFRAALRLRPDYIYGHSNLGNVLAEQGKLAESVIEFRKAVQLNPDYPPPHDGLGSVLLAQGKLDEAATELRAAVRLKPDFALAHSNLSNALRSQGKFDEAIAESQVALRLKADFPEAQANLGLAHGARGELDQAVAELRKARERAQLQNPELAQRLGPLLAMTERQATLAARLPAIITGKIKPAGAVETLELAQICYNKGLHGGSARFWTEAFRAEPKLADDMEAHSRYNAACAAALAGCGQGKDEPPLDNASRSRWRQQALEWLEADLAAWSKTLENGSPPSRQTVARTLEHWKGDLDLSGLRDQNALARIPALEQSACRALWARVDSLLVESQVSSSN